jgi:putative flavoprotein involved in K+ transport
MQHLDTIVIGAGQAGLAVSWHLTRHGRDHVVLDRGTTAQRWRHERWDSLRLLTPNWMTRLPGFGYAGPDPDGFMTATELAAYLQNYARLFGAPVVGGADVRSVHRRGGVFVVDSTARPWSCDHVVVATGWCDQPRIPGVAAGLPTSVEQVAASAYRRPGQLADGGVLVVGASASGVQIADELARAGRSVTIAVGRHTRVPRTYGGRDLFWWLERLGLLDRPVDAARRLIHEPSLQLVGRADRRDLDLAALQARGVRLAGRVARIEGGRVHFGSDLGATVAAADDQLARLIARFEAHHARGAARRPAGPGAPPRLVVGTGPESVDLRAAGISSVVWATGHRRSYPWLHLPVAGPTGDIIHDRGVTAIPGLYVVGMGFQSRRRSTFVDGVRFDAAHVVAHLAGQPSAVLAA